MLKRMKKSTSRLLAVLLAVVSIFSVFPTMTASAAGSSNLGWGYVLSNTTVYKYKYLSTSVGSVYAGEGVSILAEETNSYYIEYSTSSTAKRGYVSKSSVQTHATETCPGYMNTNATVYYGKGSNYATVGTIYSGEYVTVLADDGTWTYVEYNSPGTRKRGYIATSTLQILDKPSGMKTVYKKTGEPEEWTILSADKVYAGPSEQYKQIDTIGSGNSTVQRISTFNLNSREIWFVEFTLSNGGGRATGYILN